MLADKRISFLGGGNMAEALIKGLLAAGATTKERLSVSDRHPEKLARLVERHGVRGSSSNIDCVQGADVIVLAVKPQVLPGVLDSLGPHVPESALVLSVAAGVSTALIETRLKTGARVVRAMPNTAAMVGRSATALAAGGRATPEDLAVARAIFDAVGRTVVLDESHMDAVTGLSGSGPAYIFLIIEALSDAGVKVGLSRDVALELAAQTLLGSAHLLLETGEHPGRLKDMVTSPGGTAIAGLHTLEAGGLRTTLINAVEAATQRARELGQKA
jgi:pyrroline-5-carboxylate reductase